MKTTRTRFRAIALVLAMATVFLSLSFTVVAEDSTVISQPENITDVTEEVSFADPDEFIPAVFEVEDLREESVKHFSMPDGTYQAVSYSGAVHRKNADGTWRDIDNRLNAVTKNGFASYTTEDGRISFVQNTQSADGGSMLYTLTEGNYMIAMGIMGTSPSGNIMADDNAVLVSAGEVTNHAPKPEILVTDSAEEQLSKLRDIDNTTEILYEDILNDTDIEYVLTGNDVKENIIVKAKRDNYTYTFQMLVKGLTATANADGSITLSDETSGEAVYYIPAPYMYDANGEISYDVSYTLTEVFPEVYTLAVIADEAWIEAEDRAFPVVVDPFIASTTEAKDTVIDSNNVNSNYYGNLIRLPAKYNLTVLVQIEVPDLPYGALFNNNAQLCLFYYFHTSNPGYSRVSVYEMTGVWNEAEATYANSASLVGNTAVTTETLEWYEGMSDSEPGFAPLDISSTIYGWYYETPKDWQESYGFAVKYETEESTAPYIFFKSQECGNSEFTPFISVSYRTNIPDGVYSLENLYYDNHYINGGGYRSGTPVNVAEYDPEYYNEPTDDDSPKLDALFKISRDSDGNYIIRSMRNNALGIGTSSDSLALYSIPTNDADVDDYDKFQINWSNTDDSAVMIHPYGSTNVIYMSSLTSFDTVDEGSATASAKWKLKRYSGSVISEIDMQLPNELTVGVEYTIDPIVSSSYINYNMADISMNSCTAETDFEWDTTTQLGTLTAINEGSISLDAHLSNGVYYVNIGTNHFKAQLIIEDDLFYMMKYSSGIDMVKPIENNQLIMSAYNGETRSQLWLFEHVSSGYYKIRNAITHKYILAPSNNANGSNILQGEYNETYGLWYISKSPDSVLYNVQSKNAREIDLTLYMSISLEEDTSYLVQNESSNGWNFTPLTMNLNTYYDAAFVDLYENICSPQDAINNIMLGSHPRDLSVSIPEFFKSNFGIKVNIYIPNTTYQSFPYTSDCNFKNSPTEGCNNCKNVFPSLSEQILCELGMHHKCANKMATCTPDSTNSINILFTGHNPSCTHNNLGHISPWDMWGQAEGIGTGYKCAVFVGMFAHPDYTYKDVEAYDAIKLTTVHEILHLLGVEHHDEDNDTQICIHGEDRHIDGSIATYLTICHDCTQTVDSTKFDKLYNHSN